MGYDVERGTVQPEEALRDVEPLEVLADVAIGSGRLGEPLSTDDVRADIRRRHR